MQPDKTPPDSTLELDALEVDTRANAMEAEGPLPVTTRLSASNPTSREQVLAAIRPFIELRLELNRALHGLRQGVIDIAKLLNEHRKELGPALRTAIEVVQKFPEALRGSLHSLAMQGWYLDPEWPLPTSLELARQIADGSKEDVTRWLVDHYRSRIDALEELLCSRHPKRARIFERAFAAHRAGHYELSVPVLLSQADGIAHDLCERELYSRRPDKGLQGLIDSQDALESLFASALATPSQVNATKDERGQDFSGLNRHLVLHGIDVGYGSEENSLKALSLVNYVSFALRRRKDEERLLKRD